MSLPPIRPTTFPPFDLAAIFHEHAAGLAGAVRAILGPEVDSQEILQEAFLRGWRALRGGDRPADPVAWLFVLTMNLARDGRRTRERRGSQRGLSAEDAVLLDEKSEPGRVAMAGEVEEAARNAISKLKPEEKDVFLLRVSGGQTFDAIARSLGVPTGTAKTRMRRALCFLRRELAAFGPQSRIESHGELS